MNVESGSTHLKDYPANPFRLKNLESLIKQGRIPEFVDFEDGDYTRGPYVSYLLLIFRLLIHRFGKTAAYIGKQQPVK